MDEPRITGPLSGIAVGQVGHLEDRRLARQGVTGVGGNWAEQSGLQGEFEKRRLAQAMGGNTAAQYQMQSGLGQAQRAMAQQAGASGANPLAQRSALMAGGQMQQQQVAQAGALRAQETAAANDAYSRFQAGLGAQQMGIMQMGQEAKYQQAQATAGYEQQKAQNDQAAWNNATKIIGTIGSVAGAAMSDERSKTDIERVGASVSESGPEGPRGFTSRGHSERGPAVTVIDTSGMSRGDVARMPGYEMRPRRDEGEPKRDDAKNGLVARLAAALDRNRLHGERRPGVSDPRDETMRGLQGYNFRYRPEYVRAGQPSGRQHGIIAQDLEHTPLGRHAVRDTPAGKVLDGPAATGLTYSLLGRLNERLDAQDARMGRLLERPSPNPGVGVSR